MPDSRRVLREREDPQGRLGVLRASFATRGQRGSHGGRFVAQLGLFGRQRRLVDRPRQVLARNRRVPASGGFR